MDTKKIRKELQHCMDKYMSELEQLTDGTIEIYFRDKDTARKDFAAFLNKYKD